MRLPLQIQLLTEPDGVDEKGEPKSKPRLHVVSLPPSHADREDLIHAYFAACGREGLALARVYAALVGLSTRIGRESRADFAACSCNVYAYGGKLIDYLHEQGVDEDELIVAGGSVAKLLIESRAASADEVAAAEKNSAAVGVRRT